jgi:two-component system, NarL family, sensor kinase
MSLRTQVRISSETSLHSPQRLHWHSRNIEKSPLFWATIGLFGLVFTLELLTPPDYEIGYLYISPILFAKPRLSRSTTLLITGIAIVLTLANIWIPGNEPIHAAMVANRSITVLALVVAFTY